MHPNAHQALFTVARTWKHPKSPSPDEWIKKPWYIYIMEYYSIVKRNAFESVPMKWMKQTKGYYTEWSKSEKEKQRSYINAYIWYLEKWYWCAYWQGSSGDADVGNSLTDTVVEERKQKMERAAWKHTHCHVWNSQPVGTCCVTLGAQTSVRWLPRGVGWGGRWEGSSRGRGHTCACGWFMVMYGRNQHHIIKQLSSNER